MKTLATLTLLSAGLLLTTGCAESSTSSVEAGEVVNTHCPIMGEEIDPEAATTVDWNGKKVAFCCPPCEDEWAEMTDAEREAALEKAASGEAGGHGDHGDHGDHEGHDDHDHGHDHGEEAGAEDHGEAHEEEHTEAAPAEETEAE